MNVLAELKQRFRLALAPIVAEPDSYLDMIRPSQDPRFGDYQSNCAMPLGKQLGRPARDVATQIVQRLDVSDLCEVPDIAGPGFINLRMKTDWLVAQLNDALDDSRLAISPINNPRTYVVDFSSPNVAKPMHVGHIRSTVIGDALCRILRFAGHTVISDNHLGDWGTQFGMIIYGYRHFANGQAYQQRPLEELGRIYQLVRRLMDIRDAEEKLPEREKKLVELRDHVGQLRADLQVAKGGKDKHLAKELRKAESQLAQSGDEIKSLRAMLEAARSDPGFAELISKHADVRDAVLEETVRLHAGEPEDRRLWEEFLPRCRSAIQHIYDRIGVRFDHELGESFYHDRLGGVVQSLTQQGLARESAGAVCVFLDGYDTPMIVQKKDGAYLYATTDLATIEYRVRSWRPDVILYVVDFRQAEHFGKLFEAARQWGYHDVDLRHISFGTVLGEDGRPFKTRSGDTVGLESLLDEAERRALDVVSASDDAKPGGPELSAAQRSRIARAVGIAALKYADLAQNRTSDYVFSYNKMLALNGNTATYMQYSYARVHGIFAKGNIAIEPLRQSSARIAVDHSAERALGLQLLRFAEAIDEALADYRPNQLTNYLFDLAKSFSTFFEECPVLRADSSEQRDCRLLLCDLTARTLKQGLELLGIEVVDKM